MVGTEAATISVIPAAYAVGVMIMMALLAAVLSLLGYFVLDIKKTMNRRDEHHDQKIEQLNRDVSDLRVHVADKYVDKDNFIRTTLSLEHKMDESSKLLRSLIRKIDRVIPEKGD